MIQALLGRKLGMTRIFDENGVVTASTLVEAGPCFITQLRTQENDGYTAVQLGFGDKPRPNRPHKGHLKKAGLPDRQGLEAMREVPADSLEDLELGARIDASMFAQGEIVDVIRRPMVSRTAGATRVRLARAPPPAARSRVCAWPATSATIA